MKKDRFNKYWVIFWVIVGIIFCYSIIGNSNESDKRDNEISKNYSFVYGKIIEKNKHWFDKGMNLADYKYEFNFNGKKYNGKDVGFDYLVVDSELFYKIELSKVNPNQNRLYFFDFYKMKLIRNEKGKIIDTIYESAMEKSKLEEIEKEK